MFSLAVKGPTKDIILYTIKQNVKKTVVLEGHGSVWSVFL